MEKESKSELVFWKIFKWILKLIWNLLLMFAYGLLRLTELIAGQIAVWLKKVLNL